MTRYKLTLEYDGAPFVGWQRQDNGPSVQEALENAILKFCREAVTVTGAGRTDAGVHALGQVAHFDIDKETAPETVRDALNAHLRPHPIAVLSAEKAADDFHARFSARARHYLYRMIARRAPLALDHGRAWHIQGKLDARAMREAAQNLIGQHDFTSFRSAACQAKSPMKTLDRLAVEEQDGEIRVQASARSFLHHQVRAMVGSLKYVGEGKWQASDIACVLAARDIAACGPLAPPEGLYLVRVDY